MHGIAHLCGIIRDGNAARMHPGWDDRIRRARLFCYLLGDSPVGCLPSLLHLSMANPWTLSWKVPLLVWKLCIVRDGRGLDNYLHGNPLQYSCLENPMDKGVWRAVDHGVAKSWTWLSDWATEQRPLAFLQMRKTRHREVKQFGCSRPVHWASPGAQQ